MRLTEVQSTLAQLGEQIRPKTATERYWRAFWTAIVLVVVLFLYSYYLYSST